MNRMFIAPLAMFFEFQAIFQGLFIFETLVADSFTFGTLELDQIVLRHK
jgi:hypothetical protein